jgi:DNA-binding beta-propeller fold protein YncE
LLLIVVVALAALPQAALAGNRQNMELWVNGQDSDQIFVLRGTALVDTIALPAGTGPHITTFSPDGDFAYVAAINSGDVLLLDANSHAVVTSLDLGTTGVHQVSPSPDGALLLVAQQTTREVIKVAADPDAASLVVLDSLAIAAPARPVCSIWIPGTDKAYVSLNTQDLLIVDTATMTQIGVVDLAGQSRCNYVWSKDGATLYVPAENGVDSFLYTIDPQTDQATLLHTFAGVPDLHTPQVSANGTELYIIGRGSDAFYTFGLTDGSLTSFELGTPGVVDQPDGMVAAGNDAFINLKRTGQMAFVKILQGTITYLDLVAPSANALVNVVERP